MYIRELLNEVKSPNENIQIGDVFELELDDIVKETTVVELMDDGPVLCVDSTALSYISLNEEKVRLDPKCWKGKKIGNPKTKMKGGVRVNNCVPAESIEEGAMKDLHTELADKYRELAPKIEKYKDSYLAGELYDALEEIAARHGAMKEFRSMLNGARNRAHMDYDTNPGGFQNWFWYLPFADDEQ